MENIRRENFVRQSFEIEGIHLADHQLAEKTGVFEDFLKDMDNSNKLSAEKDKDEKDKFATIVKNYAEILGGVLRDKKGMDVIVGNYRPPRGGREVSKMFTELMEKLDAVMMEEDIFKFHKEYESLHPFTDGNGRSGRAILYWQLKRIYRENLLDLTHGFLQRFYYWSLR